MEMKTKIGGQIIIHLKLTFFQIITKIEYKNIKVKNGKSF